SPRRPLASPLPLGATSIDRRRRSRPGTGGPMVRSIVLRTATALTVALAGGAMLVATGSSATATQGQAIIAGQPNGEDTVTVVTNTSVQTSCASYELDGLTACGVDGVRGIGITGVLGLSSSQVGQGVAGYGYFDGVDGVYGENDATGHGVAGRAAN